MKIVCMVVGSFLFSTLLQAQDARTNISSALTTGEFRPLYKGDISRSADDINAAPTGSMPGDTVEKNMYGDLRKDNAQYNKKVSLWSVGARVELDNVVVVGFDRYILAADYSKIGPNTWEHNLKTGWEWDSDRFGMNYFAHPYSGSGYFTAARSNGYSYWQSVPFAFGGSLTYEYFGENTLPSYNDLINTTITGAFLGEMSYRLSSDFLDDRTTGSERFFRELFAGIIDPQRAFSRLLQGKFTRVTPVETYEKEPLNMSFAAGGRKINNGRSFGTGPTNELLTLNLAYGDPFEPRSREIFDYFRLRAELSNGLGRKLIDNIVGEGFLFGGNTHSGSMDMLIGAFQHYDYWDNGTFELGTIAFGPGMFSTLPVSANSRFNFDVHLGIIPLGANSGVKGPDTAQVRDYNYGGGAEGKFDATLNLGDWVSVRLRSYYYWIHTYVGTKGDNYIGIVRPNVVFNLFANLSLGFEHLIYYSDRYSSGIPVVVSVRTEQKIFLQYRIENFQ